jgi:hypothetical protein
VPSNNHARGYVSVEENKVFFPKKEEWEKRPFLKKRKWNIQAELFSGK